MTIQEFVSKHRVKMECEQVDRNPRMDSDPEWDRTATHYRCTLRVGRRRMIVYFSQGSAHTSEPDIASVLDCVAFDTGSVKSARDFEEWASGFGYDADSRKAECTFKVIARQAADLNRLLGADAVEVLCFETERL